MAHLSASKIPAELRKEVLSLVLYVSIRPEDADCEAEELVRTYDPHITIERIDPVETEITTPRLLALGDYFRGVRAIKGMLQQLGMGSAKHA